MMAKNKFDYSKNKGLYEVTLRVELLEKRILLNSKSSDEEVLEIGIGSGDTILMLIKNFQNVTCLDSNPEICSKMKYLLSKKSNKVKIINSKIENAKLSQIGYKHIILQNMLEHLEDPIGVLKYLKNYLNSDGYMYITVPLANSLHRILGVLKGCISQIKELSKTDIEYGHYRVYSPDLLRKHILDAGLNIEYELPFYIKPLQTCYLKQLPLEAHKDLFLLGQKVPEFASYIYIEVSHKMGSISP